MSTQESPPGTTTRHTCSSEQENHSEFYVSIRAHRILELPTSRHTSGSKIQKLNTVPRISLPGYLIFIWEAPGARKVNWGLLDLKGYERDAELFGALRDLRCRFRHWTKIFTKVQAIHYVQVSFSIPTSVREILKELLIGRISERDRIYEMPRYTTKIQQRLFIFTERTLLYPSHKLRLPCTLLQVIQICGSKLRRLLPKPPEASGWQ